MSTNARAEHARIAMTDTDATHGSTAQSLLQYLLGCLHREVRGKRHFDVNIVRSQPKRAYALFPWATDQSAAVYQEHVLVVLGERENCSGHGTGSHAGTSRKDVDSTASTAIQSDDIATGISYTPTLGIELAIYSIPATSTCLIYVSKVDTTGSLTRSAPTKLTVTAILRYYMTHIPHHMRNLRIHVFARAQDQYLFPGSIDNKRKRVLDDKALCKWWRGVLGDAAIAQADAKDAEVRPLKLFYLLAGYDEAESHALVPADTVVPAAGNPKWVYGHPYTTIPSPLPGSSVPPTLNDLIPAFQDDPKSRYLTSLTSSPVSASGEEGDYDETMEQLRRVEEASSALHKLRSAELVLQKHHERTRLISRDVDEFWICMGGRQECCSGHVAGFFVLATDSAQQQLSENFAASVTADLHQNHHMGSLPYSIYVKIWSSIHNVNYASQSVATAAYLRWKAEIRSAADRCGITQDERESEISGSIVTDNPEVPNSGSKRSEPPVVINSLQPKKKKKVAVT